MSGKIEHYYVFAEDHQIYGPADPELLKQWARDALVSPASWIYDESSDAWRKAEGLSILKDCIASHTPLPGSLPNTLGLRGGQLRRIRILADMTDEQAEKFVGLVEKIKVKAFSPIVRQGEHGDSMFLILEGEARVSVKMDGKEDVITMLGVGDFFGEIALLDAGPRSADVTANKDCTILQLSKENFENILSQEPELTSRFLVAMNRFLGSRLRATNERFAKAQNFARGVSGQVSVPNSM